MIELILCPFCKEPWSEENIKIYDMYASEGCETCGFGQEISGTIEIKCHKCGKTIYKKEFNDFPNGRR